MLIRSTARLSATTPATVASTMVTMIPVDMVAESGVWVDVAVGTTISDWMTPREGSGIPVTTAVKRDGGGDVCCVGRVDVAGGGVVEKICRRSRRLLRFVVGSDVDLVLVLHGLRMQAVRLLLRRGGLV